MELNGKIALVTGSAHRVGKHLALALAQEGCDLLVHYNQSRKAAEKTVEEAIQFGVRALPFQADLSTYEEVETLFSEIDRVFHRLDILVNSAATLLPGNLTEITPQQWDATINLNLKGAFFCLQLAAQRMTAQGNGAIVNISDVIGHKAWANFPVHSISKAGLEMLTKVAAIALAPEVRVNAIAPGMILKPEAMEQERWRVLAEQSPLKRSGTPEDLVDALLFVLKNEYLTGEILVLDGGMSLAH